jgi:hypothetical protein
MNTTTNVTTGLVGKLVQFMECPNPELSLRWGTIQGTYIDNSHLMVVVLFEGGRIETVDPRHIQVHVAP